MACVTTLLHLKQIAEGEHKSKTASLQLDKPFNKRTTLFFACSMQVNEGSKWAAVKRRVATF